jgi:hypothetical protein
VIVQTVLPSRGVLVGALVACLAAAPPVAAQQQDTTRRADTTRTVPTERPFVRGGVYDKPYLTRLVGRTAIGGYAEAHARYERVDGLRDEAGFEAKRFNLFANTRVSDFVRIGAEIEFEDGAQEILLNEFTDRPLVSTELLGVALSEPGFGAFGQFRAGRTGRLTYEVYATNGFHDGLIMDSEEGTRIRLGRRNFEDNNGSPAVVGRLAWSPRAGYELGASAHHGAYNTFDLEGAPVDRRRNLTIAALDAEATLLGVRLSAEAARATLDVPEGLRGIYASEQRGVYIEGVRDFWRGTVRTMPQSSFSIKARFDYMDFDSDVVGTSIAQVTVGLNFRPTQDSALKFDYVRGRGRDQFNNLGEHAFVLASLATYF